MSNILPLLNANDHDWVVHVGRYVLNMGAVEAATRRLIALHEGNDRAQSMTADLSSRLGFLRNRFPKEDAGRHSWAMNIFNVAGRHVGFRNIVAHSPLVITDHQDGARHIQGLLNLSKNDDKQVGELVTLEEIRVRVNESAKIGQALLEMQTDFTRNCSS